MRILLALVIVLAGCSKKTDDAPAPSASETKPAAKPEEAKPTAPPVAADDEKPTPTETVTPAADKPAADKPAAVAGAPTKEDAIQRLRDVNAALEAKDWKKAVGYFAFPAAERPRNIEEQLGKLIEQKEISAKGIDVLAAKGKYGKLAEVMEPERAARFAEKFAVKVDECYGFAVESATANVTVGFHWDGTELRLIRLNNVGKLE